MLHGPLDVQLLEQLLVARDAVVPSATGEGMRKVERAR
jgi:hypothetical protein